MEPKTTALAIEYPSLSDRIQSTFIDMMFIVLMMFAFASILDRFENPPDWIRIVFFFAIWGIYEPLCTTLGATIGNYIKGIRVRSIKDVNKRLNFFQAFVRYLFKASLGWLSFLTMHSNPERRAIHDFIGGSVMITKPSPAEVPA